jgi:hypothetical protein
MRIEYDTWVEIMSNPEKEVIKEIHSIEYLDKQLPTIYYSNKGMQSMTEGGEMEISVSDSNINNALEVFMKVLKRIETPPSIEEK